MNVVRGWRSANGPGNQLTEVPELRAALDKIDAGGDGDSRQDFFQWYILRLTRFEQFSRRNLRIYRRLRVPALIASAIVPAVIAANAGPVARVISIVLSVFVAAATGLEEFLNAGRRWRHYRATVEPLKAEGWLYVALAGPYACYPDHEQAFTDFASRIGSALVQETDDYISRALVQSPPAQSGPPPATDR
jgi:Protein of unknown function (DUF4231)